MASGAFFSRVEIEPAAASFGHGHVVLLPGDHVVTYCGDGSRVGQIVRFETHSKFTAGSCIVEDVSVAFVRDLKTGEVSEAMPHFLKLAPGWTPSAPDFDADSELAAQNYFRLRSSPLAKEGWVSRFLPRPLEDWGLLATYWRKISPADPNDPHSYDRWDTRYAVFVYKSRRKQGHLKRYLENHSTMCFITLDDCGVEEFYKKHGRDVLVVKSK